MSGLSRLALPTLLLAACVAPPDPVASVSVTPASLTLRYSEARTIDIELAVRSPLDEGVRPRVFVHLYERPVQVLRTFDFPFPGEWRPGATVRHTLRVHQSALGPALRTGRYRLSVGLYDLDGRRWPLEAAGDEIDRMEYVVGEIVVTEERSLPMFRFSETWRPIEPGQDRQILGRRWLEGAGSIWISRAESVESIWMLLQIPTPVDGLSRLLLEPGAEEPRLRVESRCGGVEAELVGSGPHEVDLRVAGDGDEECEIALRPNFHLLENGHGLRRVALLETLAWSGKDGQRDGE
jgi:hypothetical protein